MRLESLKIGDVIVIIADKERSISEVLFVEDSKIHFRDLYVHDGTQLNPKWDVYFDNTGGIEVVKVLFNRPDPLIKVKEEFPEELV